MADDVDVLDISGEELDQLFTEATDYVKNLQGLIDHDRLLFYSFYKQATEGPCKTLKPPFWDFVGKAKWESWKLLGPMDKETAMANYIKKLYSVDPDWEIKYSACDKHALSASSHQPKNKQSMGFAVSTLRCGAEDELISDASKTIFDWCKEGNVKKMDLIFSQGKDIDGKDDQGMAMLHWACDRGHDHVVDYLINKKADVNITDGEGQTPLHYAATCEFTTVIQQLLKAKADPTIADEDGFLPYTTTDNKEVKALLKPS